MENKIKIKAIITISITLVLLVAFFIMAFKLIEELENVDGYLETAKETEKKYRENINREITENKKFNQKLDLDIQILISKIDELSKNSIANAQQPIKVNYISNKLPTEEVEVFIESLSELNSEKIKFIAQLENLKLENENNSAANNKNVNRFLSFFKNQIKIKKRDNSDITITDKQNIINNLIKTIDEDFENRKYSKIYWQVKKISKPLNINTKNFLKLLKFVDNKKNKIFNQIIDNQIAEKQEK